jgi:Flp pilus assembly protein TadB
MYASDRQIALDRTSNLLEEYNSNTQSVHAINNYSLPSIPSSGIPLLLFQAGWRAPAVTIIIIAILMGFIFSILGTKIVSIYFSPFFFIIGCLIPFSIIESRISSRATEFTTDYPTVLLATASSMKIGMTPYLALERSVRLLPSSSLMRKEVELLLSRLHKGIPKELAISAFGTSIRQPDLSLFRRAFLLVVEHGGKFAPTLERLSRVSRDRAVLITEAKVSTANMRMTANILLCAAPLILATVAVQTDNYWDLLINHPIANIIASAGIVVIILSYIILQKMSRFKP